VAAFSPPAFHNSPGETVTASTPPSKGFAWAMAALVLGFAWPLYRLAHFAAQSDLYSQIFLIPAVSAFLVWSQRQQLSCDSEPLRRWAAVALTAGFVVLVGYGLAVGSLVALTEEDSLALMTSSFLLFFYGICCWFRGRETLRRILFPLVFLVFVVPLPTFLHEGVESFFQHTSAPTAGAMLTLAGTSFVREGLRFHLQGMMDFPINVAPECSGFHSTVVLLLTSLVAAHLFLHTRWKQVLLVLVVIPLGIVRNGFRIFMLLQLCVHHGPRVLDSNLHHRGGPLFFALSLIPFFLLLVILRKSDRGVKAAKAEYSGV
jgi:exosortase C (VPDSG-CTERM-specific)